MNFYKNIFLAAFILLIFKVPAFALTLAPPAIEVQTEPGQAKTFSITIYNEGRRKIEVDSSVWDLKFSNSGRKIYRAPGSFPNSIAKYISISEKHFFLDPKELKQVNLTISIPAGVVGGNQSIAFFQSSIYEPEVAKTPKVNIATRLGVIILQETKGTVEVKSRIKSVEINPPAAKEPFRVKVTVLNEGNTHIYGSGTVTVMSKDDRYIGSFKLEKSLILPKKEAVLRGELKIDLARGKYNALISYQYRDKNILINKPFNIN